MGFPPSQGHNNLRLYHTANFHHQHNTHNRLDTKHLQHSRRLNQYHHRINALKFLTEKSRLYAHPPNVHYQSTHNNSSIHSNNNNNNYSSFDRNRNISKCSRPTSLFKHGRSTRLHRSQPALGTIRSSTTDRRKFSRYSLPILSNFPLIDDSISILLVNHSPFGLRDPRFGILHHCSDSMSYF